MTNATRTMATVILCTTMALLAGSALAHDGPHQMTTLQHLLHALAWTDILPATLVIAVVVTVVGRRLTRRKATRRGL